MQSFVPTSFLFCFIFCSPFSFAENYNILVQNAFSDFYDDETVALSTLARDVVESMKREWNTKKQKRRKKREKIVWVCVFGKRNNKEQVDYYLFYLLHFVVVAVLFFVGQYLCYRKNSYKNFINKTEEGKTLQRINLIRKHNSFLVLFV